LKQEFSYVLGEKGYIVDLRGLVRVAREVANVIKYNPASLALEAARSIVAGALPVVQIASLLAEVLAAIAVSLTVILKRHGS